MKYLCLIYHDEATLDSLPGDEYDAILREATEYRDELRRGGHHIDWSALQDVDSTTTIRVRHGKVHITDGPVADTAGQLGSFYLIDARDLNEAIRLASKMPPVQFGSIEVRPVRELDVAT